MTGASGPVRRPPIYWKTQMSTSLLIVLHLIGVIMVFIGIGGAMVRAGIDPTSTACRGRLAASHGIGLLVLIVVGGLLFARLGSGLSGWIVLKIIIWLGLGAIPGILKKKPTLAGVLWWVAIILGALAAFLGVFKPF